MNLITVVGVAASVLSTISSVPQLIKIIKDRKAENVSAGMLIILISALLLWMYYGILLKNIILIISNSISVLINIAVLVFAFYYKSKNTSG